jgi:two-component system cell cycle response regulator
MPGRTQRRAALVVAAVLAVATLVWVAGVRSSPLYNAILLGTALLPIWRGIAVREGRAAWLLIGLGLMLWWAGDVWWTVQSGDIPIPSLGDALYLGTYVPLSTGIVLLVRARATGASGLLALDGLIGACALASVSAAFVIEPMLDNAAGSTIAMVVTVAYPVCDIVLVGVLVEAVALGGWVLPRAWALLAAGLVAFALADGIYYAQVAADTYVENGLLDAGWLVAMGLIGYAAWQPGARTSRGHEAGWRQLLAPGVFSAVAVAVAFYAYWTHVNAFAMALACAGLIAVIVRMVATFRDNLRILAVARREAVTDALTGLGNRRRLTTDLEDRLAAGDRHLLVLCDLDGFKGYNDRFGHPAGDALLARMGEKLAATVAATGRAYRMGGDEFCVLLDDTLDVDEAAALVGRALTEHGDGFAVSNSSGTVVLPAEAATAAEAFRLADTRMYERKRGGRPNVEAESTALLLRLASERKPELGAHGADAAELAAAVAVRLELDAAACEEIRLAAALHDLGKLAVPDSILAKPGPLDAAERAFVRRHPLIGERILVATPGLAPVGRLVRATYERLDGSGFPDGLAGDAIALGARIVAVCASYEAMVSARPYGRALSPAAALDELRRGAGSQFDGTVVDAFAAALAAPDLPAVAHG